MARGMSFCVRLEKSGSLVVKLPQARRLAWQPAESAPFRMNGRYELCKRHIKNEHGDGKKHLVIFDARTGQRLQELPDAEVLSADDLDGDGKPELLLRRGAELHIAQWKSGSLQTVWHEPNVSPVLHVPPNVVVSSVNLAIELENLSYFRSLAETTTV